MIRTRQGTKHSKRTLGHQGWYLDFLNEAEMHEMQPFGLESEVLEIIIDAPNADVLDFERSLYIYLYEEGHHAHP